MNTSTLIELFGYLGSTLVVISMLMSSVVKLRIINAVGSVVSGTYALIIGSFPLALMNGCLLAINLYNLRKLMLSEKHYDLVPCQPQESFPQYFLAHYSQDIAKYFPEYEKDTAKANAGYLVFCNGDPAGIMLAQKQPQGVLNVSLEYTTPTYRDCSVGKFLYSALPGQGITALEVKQATEDHKGYLKKMGYQDGANGYVKKLK